MKKPPYIFLLLALLIIATAIYISLDLPKNQETFSSQSDSSSVEKPTPEQRRSTETAPPPLFGESLVLGYGQGDPTADLRKIEAVISNYRLLAKGMDARHFSSNAELAATLRGEKRISLEALPTDHPIFNDDGLIIDRWDTALFFHLESADKLSIFSAGPDKKLGTEDDYSLIGGVAEQKKAEF